MTPEQLIDCDAAQLIAMSDVELLEHFKPYLNVTRPELARAASTYTSVGKHYAEQKQLPIYTDKQQAALKLLAEQGVDVSFMNRRKKK